MPIRIGGTLAWLTKLILLVSLFATVTNLIPLSTMGFAWVLFLFPLIFMGNGSVPRVTFWALLYYLVSIISLFIYDPRALITPEFYRYDGNFLISFLPLLFLPIAPRLNINLDRWIKIFVIFSLGVSLPVAIYEYINFEWATGLFIATNAFGGFLMSPMAYIVAWKFSGQQKYISILLIVISVFLMCLSSSRGSIFGIVMGVISYLAIKNNKKWIVIGFISLIVLIQGIILFQTYPVYVANKGAVEGVINENADTTKEANLYIRAYENWPRGLYLFLHSPFVGAGVGAANDIPFKFDSNSWLQNNLGGERIYSSAHAHNTYLQILGEQGLLGLSIFLIMWSVLYLQISRTQSYSMVRAGLLISFWALTFASFTEHRIPSPSNVFPFVIIFVLFYCANLPKKDLYKNEEHLS